jgi:4-amino-4-deoxy-L-arabinose transferase-like glycosyltransferase
MVRFAGVRFFAPTLDHPAAWPIFLLLNLAVGALSATLTFGGGSLHHDMTEAWMWGKEFWLGYAKHPPAFAWVAGIWFSLLPRSDGSFYLLAAVNAAVGLAGVWMIAGLLLDRPRRWAAMLMLLLMPFFSITAAKYNANTALLASWPWAVYFFLRSIDTRRLVHAAAFAALAAVALLSKYYSVVLLASCLLAAGLHPGRGRYFRSPAPYLSVLVLALLIAPHTAWVVGADFPTLKYAIAKTAYAPGTVRIRAADAVLTSLAYVSLAAGTFAYLARRQLRSVGQAVGRALLARDTAWLSALTFCPLLLTVALALGANVRISAAFLIPAFFMLPIFVMRTAPLEVSPAMLAFLLRAVVATWCALLLVAPALAYAAARLHWGPAPEPQRELARAASELWHQTFRSRLDVVAGDEKYGRALAFYAPDAPSFYSFEHPASTPWVSDKRLSASGFLMVCRTGDETCLALLKGLDARRAQRADLTVAARFLGLAGPQQTFVVLLQAPSATAP